MADHPVRLEPLGFSNAVQFLRLAFSNFRDERPTILLTVAWYFLRNLSLPNFGVMIRCREMTIMEDSRRVLGNCLLTSSALYDSDMTWLDWPPSADIRLLVRLTRNWPLRHRLVVVRIGRLLHAEMRPDDLHYGGSVPGQDGTDKLYIYYFFPRRDLPRGTESLRYRLRSCRAPYVSARFLAARCEGNLIACSGHFRTSFWPDIGWGSWAALHKRYVRKNLILDLVRDTEGRIHASGCKYFCVETTDAVEFRFARRLYELYGFERIVEIPDFYRSAHGQSGGTTYYIYRREARAKPDSVAT
jgi:hypothetical protein